MRRSMPPEVPMNLFEVLYSGCGGFVNLRLIPPASNEYHSATNLSWLPDVLKRTNHTNLYFGVATRDGKGGAKENVIDIPALWVDIDFKSTPKERFDAAFPTFKLPPTAVVLSGGGYHIYWKLKTPATKIDKDVVENLLRRLAFFLSGDSAAAEIARVLRVPGSLNNKPEYAAPIPVVLQSIDPTKIYSLKDFEFLPKLASTSKSTNEIGWYLDSLKGVSEGERGNIAAKLAGRYIYKGLSENETCAILELWNHNNKPPLDRTVIERTVRSIKSTDSKNPKESTGIDAHHVTTVIETLKKKISDGITGIDPCYNFLKQTVRYIQRQTLWIVGGYTSVGKSFFISDLLMRVMDRTENVGIALFSTEMSSHEYMVRFLSNRTCIKSYLIKENKAIAEYQRDSLAEAYGFMALQNLHLYDNLYRFEDIEAKATEIKEKKGLDIIVIDFIQNLQGSGSIYERMSYLSPIIQEVAKKLNVCIIALSQVSNEAAKSDIDIIGYKGAGEIAAAADLGLWLERDKDNERRLSMIVRKNRYGAKGQTVLEYDEDWTRLEEVNQ
jgi:replicative DNA helicase